MKTAFALLATVALLSGCSESKKTEEAPAISGQSTVPVTKVADGSTGVSDCDEYIEKVKACINERVPEAQRGIMEQSMDQVTAQWATIGDKSALAKSCKMALEQAKASYAAMGCKF